MDKPTDDKTPKPEKAPKVDNKAVKEASSLHNDILRTLEAERDVIGDITAYQAQLAKLVQKSVGAHDMTTDLARAQRDLAQDTIKLQKDKSKLSADDYNSQLASNKAASVYLAKSIALNKTIQQVSKNMAPVADFGTDMADSLNSFVTALPGGKALSKMFGIDDLSDRVTSVVNTMSGDYIKALQAGKSPTEALAAGMKGAGNAMKAMLSPALLFAVAIAGIAMLFKGISDLAKKTATDMGVTFAQAKKLNDAARQAQSSYGTQLATLEDITAVQKEQIALLGSAALVNTKVAASVADMGKAFGYGAEQAGKTHATLMLIGASQEQASAIQLKTSKKALLAGVSVAAVQSDIADNAKGALKYLGGSAEAMADAAVKAAKLGVSLGTMTKVADALLDIEGSLTAQFEFQALTGSEINLDLARQKALQGDIAGATEEVLKNIKSSAEFDKMGVFAKEALAKATGVSVEELQKSLMIQEKLGSLNDDQKAAAANLNMSAAEMKDLSAEDLKNKLAQQQSMDKAGAAFESIKNQLSSALLPLAEAFGSVFSLLGPILKTVGVLIGAILAPLTAMMNIFKGNTSEMSGFQKILGGVLIAMTAIKGVTLLMNAQLAIKNALTTTYGTLTGGNLVKAIYSNTVEKAGNLLRTVGNFLFSGRIASMATANALSGTGNTIDATGNTLKGSANALDGIMLTNAGVSNTLGVTGNALATTKNTIGATGNALGVTGNVLATTKNAIGATGIAFAQTGNALGVTGNVLAGTGNALGVTGNVLAGTGNALGVTGNTIDAAGIAWAQLGNALGVTGNVLATTKNTIGATGNVLAGTGNALDVTGNALALASNVQEGITTGAKAAQLGLGTGIAAASAAGAAATTGALAGQIALTTATAAGAGAQAGLAAAALTTNAAMTFGIGTVIAIAAAALAIGALGGYMMKADSSAKSVGDLSSPAQGKTQVSTAEGGLFETSKNDDVAAGPGILSKIQGAASNPLAALGSLFGGGGSEGSGDGGSSKILLEKLDLLIAAVKTPPPVYIGNKAVTELASALQINDSFQTTPNVTGGSE